MKEGGSMWQYRHSDELYHHGVKGMKWGVRRASQRSTGDRKQAKARFKKDVEEAKKNGINYDIRVSGKNVHFKNPRLGERKISDTYAKKLTRKITREQVAKVAATSAVLYGSTVVTKMLSERQ